MSKVGWIESPYGDHSAGPAAALRYASYCMSFLYLNDDCDFVYIAPHMCYGHLPEEIIEKNDLAPFKEENIARATCWYKGKPVKAYRDFSAMRNTADVVYFFLDLGFSEGMQKSMDECKKLKKKTVCYSLLSLKDDLIRKKNKDAADETLLHYLLEKEDRS